MTGHDTELSESLENYLETILELEGAQKVARAKDIAEKLAVKRGSVTGALRALSEKGLINYRPYSFITLTAEGRAIAREVRRRHLVIKEFLQNVLMLSAERADKNACRMEHAMDQRAVNRLVQFIEYVQYCPRAGQDWIRAFVDYYSKRNHDRQDCRACIESCVERYEQDTQ